MGRVARCQLWLHGSEQLWLSDHAPCAPNQHRNSSKLQRRPFYREPITHGVNAWTNDTVRKSVVRSRHSVPEHFPLVLMYTTQNMA